MAIELYKHNEEAYEKTIKMFKEKDKCAIIHPTSTGKSYIALKWLLDNKDKKAIYITSQLAIKDQLERTIIENNLDMKTALPNLTITTYSGLRKNNDMMADLIVLDEFHRAGAPIWGKAVEELINNNKNAKVLGLTATPIRYLDKNRNMVNELFEGNVSSHITVAKALADGILSPPVYVNAIYSFKDDIEQIEEKISNITNEKEKQALEQKLKIAKRTIENAMTLPELFKKYMTRENGKYLVFCRDIKHLEEMKDESQKWFEGINKNIEPYYMHSLEEEEHNKYTLDRFHYVKNDKLKLLYSVGMLNEGIHVKDIDGVIMLRPTSSPILYFQQLGRALTTGKDNKPLVFDVVNNIECLKDIELLRNTVIRIMVNSNKPKKEIQKMQEAFKIVDEYKTTSNLIKDLSVNATYGFEGYSEYLNEINKIPYISKLEEQELLQKAKNGDNESRKKLCEANLSRIATIVKNMSNPNISFEDLMNEGVVLFYEALDKYELTNKMSFNNFVYHTIYRKLSSIKNNAEFPIKISKKDKIQIDNINQITERYKRENHRRPSNEELSQELNIPLHIIYELKELNETAIPIEELSDSLIYNNSPITRNEEISEINQYLKILDEESQKILKLRFGLEDGNAKTLEETSEITGIKKETIRKKEGKALNNIKGYIFDTTVISKRQNIQQFRKYINKYCNDKTKSIIIALLNNKPIKEIEKKYHVSEEEILKICKKHKEFAEGLDTVMTKIIYNKNKKSDLNTEKANKSKK